MTCIAAANFIRYALPQGVSAAWSPWGVVSVEHCLTLLQRTVDGHVLHNGPLRRTKQSTDSCNCIETLSAMPRCSGCVLYCVQSVPLKPCIIARSKRRSNDIHQTLKAHRNARCILASQSASDTPVSVGRGSGTACRTSLPSASAVGTRLVYRLYTVHLSRGLRSQPVNVAY